MRDRLIELIKAMNITPEITCPRHNTDETCNGCKYELKNNCNFVAREVDYLIENGGLFPPLKVGQELWDIHYNKPRKWKVVYIGYNGKEWHFNIHWWKDRHNFKTTSITYPFVGKMWYFTKEEAEQALIERKMRGNERI